MQLLYISGLCDAGPKLFARIDVAPIKASPGLEGAALLKSWRSLSAPSVTSAALEFQILSWNVDTSDKHMRRDVRMYRQRTQGDVHL